MTYFWVYKSDGIGTKHKLLSILSSILPTTQLLYNGLPSVQNNGTIGNGICRREHNKTKQTQKPIF